MARGRRKTNEPQWTYVDRLLYSIQRFACRWACCMSTAPQYISFMDHAPLDLIMSLCCADLHFVCGALLNQTADAKFQLVIYFAIGPYCLHRMSLGCSVLEKHLNFKIGLTASNENFMHVIAGTCTAALPCNEKEAYPGICFLLTSLYCLRSIKFCF